ncbi:MAG: DUF4168 domain-containing protein [Gemmatimonadota bacterium]
MSNVIQKALSVAAVLALALFVMPGAVDAQVGQQQLDDITPPEQEELTRFAHGLIDITGIEQEMQQELAGVQDVEEATQIQQAANQEMVAALDDYGLTPERYSEIAQLLEADEELQVEFQEVYHEAMEERGDGVGSLN